MRKPVVREGVLEIVHPPRLVCPHCLNDKVFQYGLYKTDAGAMRYYNCQVCNRQFRTWERNILPGERKMIEDFL